MEKFIPYAKLSKKKKRELDAQKRGTWTINPVTRKPPNPRAYDRNKARKWRDDDSVSVPFYFKRKKGRSLFYPFYAGGKCMTGFAPKVVKFDHFTVGAFIIVLPLMTQQTHNTIVSHITFMPQYPRYTQEIRTRFLLGMGVHKTVWVSGSGNGVASRVTPFPFA